MGKRKHGDEPPLPTGEFAGHRPDEESSGPEMTKINWDSWLSGIPNDTLRSEIEVDFMSAIKPVLRRIEQAGRQAKAADVAEALAVIEGFSQSSMYRKLESHSRGILDSHFADLKHCFSFVLRTE